MRQCALIERAGAVSPVALRAEDPEAPVFRSRQGGALGPSQVHRIVKHAAKRARREYVSLRRQRLVWLEPAGPELVRERALARVDVGNRELRSGRVQPPRELGADVAQGDRDRAAQRCARRPRAGHVAGRAPGSAIS